MLSTFISYFIFPAVIIFIIAIVFFILLNTNDNSESPTSIPTQIFEIDKMSGSDFEKYLELLFQKLGYTVYRSGSSQKYTGDYGADLIIERDGTKTAVQAKRWNYMVKEKAVQEVVTAKAVYGCSNAMVVTNNYFSKHAINLASANNVILWNRNQLIEKIQMTTDK